MPKVSICIPAYNRRNLFRATLWSVLQQTFPDFEVLVSDNASEEDLKADVIAANDPRVRYFRQKTNIGGQKNFLFLQTKAAGEYVLFLCSDDLLMPDCLAKAVAAMDAQPQRGAAVYKAAHYSDQGFQYLSTMPEREFAAEAEYASDRSVRDFKYTSPSLCFYRRAVFDRLGRWDENLIAAGDWEMYSRVARCGGGVLFLHDVLAIMRLHDDRDSHTHALHWGFYHDVLLLATRPELRWGNSYRARVVVEQLLWDWRLKRSPRRTLAYAYNMGAIPAVVLYLPWEIMRRVGLKLRWLLGFPPEPALAPATTANSISRSDIDSWNAFWNASETIRAQACRT